MTGVVVWSISIALLGFTILTQRPRWNWVRTWKYRDVAAFVPSWTFFAPNPGTRDTRVLWRECLVDGAVSPWHELHPPTGGYLRAIWNPRKRQSKLLTDAGPMILRMALKDPKNPTTLVSLPYLLLLNHVTNLPSSPLVTARQFVVVQTRNSGDASLDMEPLFASRWHAMERQSRGQPFVSGPVVPDMVVSDTAAQPVLSGTPRKTPHAS